MPTDTLLRVNAIRVESLFGRYTHEVSLRTADRVTIIHGPNGVGKTVLLHSVAALLLGNLGELRHVPFSRLDIALSDGTAVGFARSSGGASEKTTGHDGTPYLRQPDGSVEYFKPSVRVDRRQLALDIEQSIPWITRMGKDQFLDERTNELLTSGEVLSRYPQQQVFLGEVGRHRRQVLPDPLRAVTSRVRVHLIEAQRLLRHRSEVSPREGWHGQPYVATVDAYAREFQERMSRTLAAYAKESQALDQSFPQRLLQAGVSPLSVDDLVGRMTDLEGKRQQLKRGGLIDKDVGYPFDVAALESLDETRRTVMTLYVEDTARKLGVLDELAQRVEILLSTLNRKFSHKRISLDREKGLVARTDDDKPLRLDSLSSGEQHELVLAYDLLFRVQPNTLVLIDEPELSLHVSWQKSFLPDLLEIVATAQYDVLLATHSPFIVGDRHDLMVPLSANGAARDEAAQE